MGWSGEMEVCWGVDGGQTGGRRQRWGRKMGLVGGLSRSWEAVLGGREESLKVWDEVGRGFFIQDWGWG